MLFFMKISKKSAQNAEIFTILIFCYYLQFQNLYLFIYRTLPVATIDIIPSNTPKFAIIDLAEARAAGQTLNMTFNSGDATEYIYFTLVLPVTFSTPYDSPSSMKLDLTISVDANEPSKNPRAFFLQNGAMTSVLTLEIDLVQTQYNTENLKVFLKRNRNFLRPIPFDFEYDAINPSTLDFNTSLSITNPRGIPRYEVSARIISINTLLCNLNSQTGVFIFYLRSILYYDNFTILCLEQPHLVGPEMIYML